MTTSQRIDYITQTFGVNSILASRIATEIKSPDSDNVRHYLNSKPKPFVKWVGGKRQLLTQFKELGLYPPAQFNPLKNSYYEPFVGGGALFFDLLPIKATLSDVNAELIVTYNVIKEDVESLINELNSGEYAYDKNIFLAIRACQTTEINELKRAARFIYLNRTAFNGMYRVNKSGQFNVPFGKYANPQICDVNNLRNVSKVLASVSIKNNSYQNVLETAKKGDFVYFDPPYYPVTKTASFTSYDKTAFLEKEQEELRDTFMELHNMGCYVMLSNSDTPFINNLFKPCQKEGITINIVQAGRAINSNAGKRGKVSEVLVTNYA